MAEGTDLRLEIALLVCTGRLLSFLSLFLEAALNSEVDAVVQLSTMLAAMLLRNTSAVTVQKCCGTPFLPMETNTPRKMRQ